MKSKKDETKYKNRPWSRDELLKLKEYYNKVDKEKLLALFPTRTYESIKQKAYYLRKRQWKI